MKDYKENTECRGNFELFKLDGCESFILYILRSERVNGLIKVNFDKGEFNQIFYSTEDESEDWIVIEEGVIFDFVRGRAIKDYNFMHNQAPFSKKLINVIKAVKSYSDFLQSYHIELLGNNEFDVIPTTEQFFYNLPDTAEIRKCVGAFKAIMNLSKEDVVRMENIPGEELEKHKFKWEMDN